MNDHGLLAISVTVLLAAFAGTWRLSSLATRLEQQLETLKRLPDITKVLEERANAQDTKIALIIRDLQSIAPPPRPRHQSGNFDHE